MRGRAPVVDAQLAHLREAVAEIQCGCDVGDSAHGIGLVALVVLAEVRLLRLQVHAGVEVEFLSYHAEHHLNVVSVVLIFRESAQIVVAIVLIGIAKPGEVGIPRAVERCGALGKVVAHVGEVVGRAVALRIRIGELIAELQEGSLPERFAVGCLQRVAVVACGREVESVGIVYGVLCRVQHRSHLIECDVAGGKAFRFTLGDVGIGPERNVAPHGVEFPVQLQHAAEAFRVAVAHRCVVARVNR